MAEDPADNNAATDSAIDNHAAAAEDEEDDEEAKDEKPHERAEKLKKLFSKALVRRFSPTPRAVAAAIVEDVDSMVKFKKWSNIEDSEELKKVSARALLKINQREADSWIESMEDLKRVLNETLLEVEGRIELSKKQEKEKVLPALEDVMDLAEVRYQLIPEVKKVWADLLM